MKCQKPRMRLLWASLILCVLAASPVPALALRVDTHLLDISQYFVSVTIEARVAARYGISESRFIQELSAAGRSVAANQPTKKAVHIESPHAFFSLPADPRQESNQLHFHADIRLETGAVDHVVLKMITRRGAAIMRSGYSTSETRIAADCDGKRCVNDRIEQAASTHLKAVIEADAALRKYIEEWDRPKK